MWIVFPHELEGMTLEEVAKRQKQFGPNKLPTIKRERKLFLFLKQFKSSLVYILLIASIISIFLGDYIEIEAEEHRLPRILSVIGYNMSDGITKNYTRLFFDYCDLRGWNHDVPQTFEEENKHKAKA